MPWPRYSGIEIHLPSRPRSYRRGDGPTTALPTIALANDATAYIIEKSVLPLVLPTGSIKLQMHYLVRWTDLPAASLPVPATDIMDYVSPRALEDFEYELSLDRDRAEETEGQLTAVRPPLRVPEAPAGRGGKRGRPARLPVADLLDDATAGISPPSSGPSLSTPRKTLALETSEGPVNDLEGDIEGGEEDGASSHEDTPDQSKDEVEDSAASITRQLQGDHESAGEPRAFKAPNPLAGFYKNGNGSSATSRPEARTPASSKGIWASGSVTSSKKFVQTSLFSSGFTPAGRSASSALATAETPQSTQREKRKKRKIEMVQKDEGEGEGELVWEVKRLEEDRIDVVDGKARRHFKVRWEGNWPPDQNPTWEPQENLPPGLVRRYLKKRARTTARLDDGLAMSVPPQTPRKYLSVAEAFEGDAGASEVPLRHWDDEEAEVEKFTVTGSPQPPFGIDGFGRGRGRGYGHVD